MQFQTNQIGHRKHLREQHADIVEMRENAVGAFVSFTAENFVTINAEPVEEIFLFARRFLDEPPYHSLSRIEFSRMHFELRTKTDEVCRDTHARSVSLTDAKSEGQTLDCLLPGIGIRDWYVFSANGAGSCKPGATPQVYWMPNISAESAFHRPSLELRVQRSPVIP